MLNWQAIIFDFDGVLADSVDVKTKAFAKLFESYGPRIVKKVIHHHKENGGMSRFDKFQYYFSEFIKEPLSEEDMGKLSQEFSNLVVQKVVEASEIKGASKFLIENYIKVPCFVNSATPQDEIRVIVKRRGWHSFFKEILGSPQTKIQNLEFILETYQLNPQKCIFLGDAISDYKAAMALNVNFFGISENEFSPLVKYANAIHWGKDFDNVKFHFGLE